MLHPFEIEISWDSVTRRGTEDFNDRRFDADILEAALGSVDIQFPNRTSQPVQVIGVDDITLSGLPPLKKNLSSERNRLTVVVVTTARGVSPQILAGRIKERTGLKARSADDLKKTPSGGFRPTPKTLATSPPCFPWRLQSTSA